jgi:SagB-type dehydrogenase family enzyme
LPEAAAVGTTTSIHRLPPPVVEGGLGLAAALAGRRTNRELSPEPLSDTEIGQLLWAAQGVTHEDGRRTSPSASALFALEVHVATGAGLAHYRPKEHALETVREADLRPALEDATGGQPFVGSAPLVVIISAVAARLEPRHGPERAVRYADFEAGHAGQGLLLQAVALGLAGVPVGSFDDAAVARLLGLPGDTVPRYLFAIGRPA